MSRLFLALLLVTVSVAFADEDAQQPASDAPPTVETTVEGGDLPLDIRGVWLIVSSGEFQRGGSGEFQKSGRFRNGVDILAIQTKDGKLDVQPALRELPADVQTQLDDANKQWKAWTPSPEQVAAVGSSLDQLKPVDPMTYFRHVSKIMAPSKDGGGELPPDSKFAIDVEHVYRPHPADEKNIQLMIDKATYVAKDTSPTQIHGDMTRSILAASFIPVPLNTRGTFTMYRIRSPEQLPSSDGSGGGIRAFLAGLFRGCR